MKQTIILVFIFFSQVFSQIETVPDSLLRDEPIKDPTKSILLSVALPGAGQFYNESYIKSALYFSTFSFFVGQAFQYSSNKNEFESYETMSINQLPSQFILNATDRNISLIVSEKKDAQNKRNRALWRALGVYVLNILDAYAGAYLFRFDDLIGSEEPTKKTKLNIDQYSYDGLKINFSYHF